VTAQVLREAYRIANGNKPVSNLYLSPLSTKAQCLGFALFYLRDLIDRPASIIYPMTEHYSKETTQGLSGIWQYRLDF